MCSFLLVNERDHLSYHTERRNTVHANSLTSIRKVDKK